MLGLKFKHVSKIGPWRTKQLASFLAAALIMVGYHNKFVFVMCHASLEQW